MFLTLSLSLLWALMTVTGTTCGIALQLVFTASGIHSVSGTFDGFVGIVYSKNLEFCRTL